MVETDPECRRGERLEELLDTLESIPASEHEDYLLRACPDAELRREVLSLLTLESESVGYLEGFVKALAPKGSTPSGDAGRRIGAWRLLRPLGRGGMGMVYEAERADGAFAQRAALKLLTTALADTEAYSRFLAERRILAGLEHPAIARIVDGGVTEDDTPWFAMEYIEGVPIDAYCDRRRLGIRERLKLVLQVCDAVEHAHRRLVVHRDLKPSNVLVTEDGKVKLLDFGIAKLLDADMTRDAAPPTHTGLRMMTPEYASPEQVRGEAMSTASDVYQLGLLLYELLTGHWPYPARDRRVGELERAICERMPTRPSTAVRREDTLRRPGGTAASSVEEICRARRSWPGRLQRRLRGDLDNIVLKALSKEPERRYGSADRLAQDIRRHLDGLPVAARAETWTYRGRKFLERHAVGAAAAALVLVLAAGMAVFHTLRIQSERDRAQSEAAKAEQMSQFLAGLFRSADPRQARGTELTARELLDRGVQRVDHELATQPEIRADMLHVLGRTYLELSSFHPAERLLTRTLGLRQRWLGPNHLDVAMVLGDLGMLSYRQGDYPEARERLNQAIRILERSLGIDAPQLVDILRISGQVDRSLGEYEKGRATLERALAIHAQAADVDSETTAGILGGLGLIRFEMGALQAAEGLFARALALQERELGPDHPLVGSTLINLALVRLQEGKLEGLEALYRRALSILRNVYGPDDMRVGMGLNNLGDFLTVAGQIDEAIEVLQQALDVQSAAVGSSHPEVAHPLASLGDAYLRGGYLPEARLHYKRSVAVREGAPRMEEFDPLLAHGLVRLARVEAELGNAAASNQALNRALAIWRRAPASTDPRLTPTLLDLGRLLTEQRRCAAALPLLQRAARIERARSRAASSHFAELTSLLDRCSA